VVLKDKGLVGLIQRFLDKSETRTHLVRVHNLVLDLQEKQAPKKSTVKGGHAGATTRWGTAWSGAHLRPMYRTVHRTIPREMVLRAIRWVNPKRMFPIMNMTKEKLMEKDSEGNYKISKEEFESAFVELSAYRREAHVINNRYNQMLRMIDAGQLPYYIPYANISSQKWKDLGQYRDRAQRLGLGAADWGSEIDDHAEMFRQVYQDGRREGKLDNIDGLWEDAKGHPTPPPFFRKKERKALMRARRQGVDRFKFTIPAQQLVDSSGSGELIVTAENADKARDKAFVIAKNKKLMHVDDAKFLGEPKKLKRAKVRAAQVWAREFVAVPKGEIRPGELVRMPAERQVEGAAVFLLRYPRNGEAWMDDKQWRDLERGRGPVTVGPKDAKVEIHYSEVALY